MSSVKVDTAPRPIADEAKAEITAALNKSIKQHKQQLTFAREVCDALAPIAHYKNLDKRMTTFLEKALPHLHVYIHKSYSTRYLNISWSRAKYQDGVDPDLHNLRYEPYLPDHVQTVQGIIDLLAEAQAPTVWLDQAEQQLALLPQLFEAEAQARNLMQQYEDLRKDTSVLIFGEQKYGYAVHYHATVRQYLTSLTAV